MDKQKQAAQQAIQQHLSAIAHICSPGYKLALIGYMPGELGPQNIFITNTGSLKDAYKAFGDHMKRLDPERN